MPTNGAQGAMEREETREGNFAFSHILSEESLWRTIHENNNKTFQRFFVFENSGIM